MTPPVATDDDYELVSPITAGVYQSGLVREFPAGVTAVLALCTDAEMRHARAYGYPDPFSVPGLLDYAWRPLPDDFRRPPSLDWLDATAALVGHWRAAGRVVHVHCAAGVSRSTLATAAYLMRSRLWPAADALAFVRVGRPVANPNRGFLDLLAAYERRLGCRPAA
jgi:protein-tyrosine phosphatase